RLPRPAPPPLRRLGSSRPSLAPWPPTSPTALPLEVEGERPLFPAEGEPDPSVQSACGGLERPAELLRVIALREAEAPALLRRKLFEFLPVLLHQRQELRRQPVLQFPDRHGLELGHVRLLFGSGLAAWINYDSLGHSSATPF